MAKGERATTIGVLVEGGVAMAYACVITLSVGVVIGTGLYIWAMNREQYRK